MQHPNAGVKLFYLVTWLCYPAEVLHGIPIAHRRSADSLNTARDTAASLPLPSVLLGFLSSLLPSHCKASVPPILHSTLPPSSAHLACPEAAWPVPRPYSSRSRHKQGICHLGTFELEKQNTTGLKDNRRLWSTCPKCLEIAKTGSIASQGLPWALFLSIPPLSPSPCPPLMSIISFLPLG